MASAIGGLCAKTLAFENGVTLEEIIVRHALGEDVSEARRRAGAAGVMMIPVPRRHLPFCGWRFGCRGHYRRSDHHRQRRPARVPAARGNTYMGFLFAYGETTSSAEDRLRRAHHALRFEIPEMLPVVSR